MPSSQNRTNIRQLLDEKIEKFYNDEKENQEAIEDCLNFIKKDIVKNSLSEKLDYPYYCFLIDPEFSTQPDKKDLPAPFENEKSCDISHSYKKDENELQVYYALILKDEEPKVWCKFFIGVIKRNDQKFLFRISSCNSEEINLEGDQGNIEHKLNVVLNSLLDQLESEVKKLDISKIHENVCTMIDFSIESYTLPK